MTGRSGDPVPSIPEAEATGEVAALYDDIRRTLGVSVVNLIWRNLAAMPGALTWAWGAVKPLYVHGAIQGEAQALRREQVLPAVPVLPAAALRSAGVSTSDEVTIRQIVAAYDRSNALNLLALLAMIGHLRGASAGQSASTPTPPAVPVETLEPGALPPILSLEAMMPDTALLVQEINRLGARGRDHILVSMPRHLAYWPGFLAIYWSLVAPFEAGGQLTRCIDAVFADATQRASRLLLHMDEVAIPDARIRSSIERTLDDFARNAISRMVPVTALLLAALGGRY